MDKTSHGVHTRREVCMKSLLVVAALAISALTLGQNPPDLVTLTVTVKDSAGAVIPGVTVAASGPGGSVRGVTSERGSVDLRVAPGTTRVTASLTGFSPGVREVSVKESGQTIDITLQVAPPLRFQSPQSPFDRGSVDIQADNMTLQGNLVLYRGNVRMRTNSTDVRADEMDFNTVTRTASAPCVRHSN